MSEAIIELTDANFSEAIRNGVVLVDFWAPWCAPCRMQTPILERVAAQVGDKATIAKLNVDEAPGVAGAIGIRSIPTLVIFKDNEPVKGFVGVQNEQTLVNAIEEVAEPTVV